MSPDTDDSIQYSEEDFRKMLAVLTEGVNNIGSKTNRVFSVSGLQAPGGACIWVREVGTKEGVFARHHCHSTLFKVVPQAVLQLVLRLGVKKVDPTPS
jgi:hypothetical protein